MNKPISFILFQGMSYSMKLLVHFILCTLVLCVSLSAVHANADDKMSKAQDLVAQARVSLRSGQLKKAIQLFQQAHGFVPTTDYLFAIASIHSRIEGNCVQTIEAWEHFLRNCPDCSRKAKGEKQIKFHKKFCQVTINVDSDPSGADVKFDEQFIGKTPISFRTIAGKHTIQWTLDGHHPFESEVILLKGRELVVKRVTLIPINEIKVTPVISAVTPSEDPKKSTVDVTAATLVAPEKNNTTEWILISAGGVLTTLGVVSVILAYSELDAIQNASTDEEYERLVVTSSRGIILKNQLGYSAIGVGLGLLSYGLFKFEF